MALIAYLKQQEVVTEEEKDKCEEEAKMLKVVAKMVLYIVDKGYEVHESKKQKLSIKQDSAVAAFLTFCHFFFVVHPGANADTMKKLWKTDDGVFPRKNVGEWFANLRQHYRARVRVWLPPLVFWWPL